MAMTTNASAGVIYFNQAFTVGPVGNVAQSSHFTQSQNITLKSALGANVGAGFEIFVGQSATAASHNGLVSISGLGGLSFLFSTRLAKLASGANISTTPVGYGWRGGKAVAFRFGSAGNIYGWAPGATGFAGFRFSTTNHALDDGWVRLSYTLGSNGSPNGITATDWAYDPTGAPVTTGEGAAPEPSTMALAILAAGAARVAALRRRRHQAGETACPTFSDAAA